MNNCLEINKINSQLKRADVQKSRLFSKIYRGYEIYLNLVRDQLYTSAEKGLYELYSYLSIKDNFLDANKYFFHFEKKLRELIYTNLPLLTVEQLKINEIEKNIKKKINFNSLGSQIKIKDYQKERFQYEDVFQFDEPIQFQISENIPNSSKYYPAENNEKLGSLDLDNNYLSNNKIIDDLGVEKQFISSQLELIEKVKVDKPRCSEKENINQFDILSKHQSLNIFNKIDNSLENLLLNLSYKINQELFNADLIKEIISKDSFEYLVGKKMMIKHPHPFVINFEFDINQSSNNSTLRSISLFNISIVELEFKNLNLCIQRNKINELKNQFQRLIKKEKFWRQKEITFNKIN